MLTGQLLSQCQKGHSDTIVLCCFHCITLTVVLCNQHRRGEAVWERRYTVCPVWSAVLVGSLASSQEKTVGSSLYVLPFTVLIRVRTVWM